MVSIIKVNPSARYQTVEGFGASGAWWAQDVGGWENDQREHIARLLFDRRQGIGLSIYRYNIGGGSGDEIRDPWRRGETFEIGEGVYDWSRDRNALWVIKAAQAMGVERFVAFVNSPPARMTRSGFVSGAATDERGNDVDFRVWMSNTLSTLLGRKIAPQHSRSNLRPDMITQFARYLVDVVRYLREGEGIPVGWISPINEPQWAWCRGNQQEGCHYTPDECVSVARALVRAIDQSGMDVKVSVVESGLWLFSGIYMRKLLGDPELAPYLDTFGLHSYQSTRLARWLFSRYARRRYPDVRLWMSEWVEMRRGTSVDMTSALTLADTIHQDLTVGGVTSWQYWIAVSKYDFHDGLIYVDPETHAITETKRLWVMGNYCRLIRPGDVRVAARCHGGGLKVIAFCSDARHETLVVAINPQEEGVTARLSFLSASTPTEMIAFETSDARNLARVYHGQKPETISLAPRSVTTLVFFS